MMLLLIMIHVRWEGCGLIFDFFQLPRRHSGRTSVDLPMWDLLLCCFAALEQSEMRIGGGPGQNSILPTSPHMGITPFVFLFFLFSFCLDRWVPCTFSDTI